MDTSSVTEPSEPAPTLERVLAVLRRRALWIVIPVVVATGAAFVVSKLETKRYTATASLLFNTTNAANSVAGLSTTSTNSTEQSIQDTNVELLKIGDMAAKTARLVGHGLTADSIRDALDIHAVSDTSVLDVAATAGSPLIAQRLANTYSGIFVNEQENETKSYYNAALATVNAQLARLPATERLGAQGLALQERADSLATVADLPSATVSIAADALLPTSPSSPKVARNTAIGLLLGLFVGIAAAFLLERLDQRIREPTEFEEIYAIPMLGAVPDSRRLALATRRSPAPAPWLGSDLEAFHLILAHLRYFSVDRELRTLLVASATVGDGKTTVATHLCAAAAQMGSRVVLVEADLRRPKVARYIGVDQGPGLCDAIIGATPLDSVVQRAGVPGDQTAQAAPSFDVITAGSMHPPNPAELFGSQAFESILSKLTADYDTVIIDTAPLGAVSDTFPLLAKVDGVLLVGRVNIGRRDVAARLRRTLTAGQSHLLGVVVNGVSPRSGGYEYGYYS